MCKHYQYIHAQCGHAATAPFAYEVCNELCPAKLDVYNSSTIQRRHYAPYQRTLLTQRLDIQQIFVDSKCRRCTQRVGGIADPYGDHPVILDHQKPLLDEALWHVPQLPHNFPFNAGMTEEEWVDSVWSDAQGEQHSPQSTSSSRSSRISPRTIRSRRTRSTDVSQNHIENQVTTVLQPQNNDEAQSQFSNSTAASGSLEDPLQRAPRVTSTSSSSNQPLHIATRRMRSWNPDLPKIEAISSLVPAPLTRRRHPQPMAVESSNIPPTSSRQQQPSQQPQNTDTSRPAPQTSTRRTTPDLPPLSRSEMDSTITPKPLFFTSSRGNSNSKSSSAASTKTYTSTSTQTDDQTDQNNTQDAPHVIRDINGHILNIQIGALNHSVLTCPHCWIHAALGVGLVFGAYAAL